MTAGSVCGVPTIGSPLAPYALNAVVLEVIDGDTFRCWADYGDRRYEQLDVRLWGINAREHDDLGGPEATLNLRSHLLVGSWVVLTTPNKYATDARGRTLALVRTAEHPDLAARLVAEQYAAGPYYGRGTKPVPPWPRLP